MCCLGRVGVVAANLAYFRIEIPELSRTSDIVLAFGDGDESGLEEILIP